METIAAQSVFDSKWTNVRRIVQFRAIHMGLRQLDQQELEQEAACFLWVQSLKRATSTAPFEIDCQLVLKAALSRWWRKYRGRLLILNSADLRRSSDGGPEEQIERVAETSEPTIRIHDDDGTAVLSMVEVELDRPEELAIARTGVSARTLAARLGIHVNSVHAMNKDGRLKSVRGENGRKLFHPTAVPKPLRPYLEEARRLKREKQAAAS